MSCPQCNLEFNSTTIIPLILPECGDTLCSSCITKTLPKGSVICPEGRKINHNITDIATLSMNIPLLHSCSDFGEVSIGICQIHNKNFQAFCETEQILVCIDCILLKGHKLHEITTIEEAYEKAKNYISSNREESKRLSESLKIALECVGGHKDELKNEGKEQNEIITKEFENIINNVKKYEDTLKINLEDALKNEYEKLDKSIENIKMKLKLIEKFLKDTEGYENINNFKLFENYNEFIKNASEATKKFPLVEFSAHLPEFSLKQEMTKLWKIISSNFCIEIPSIIKLKGTNEMKSRKLSESHIKSASSMAFKDPPKVAQQS